MPLDAHLITPPKRNVVASLRCPSTTSARIRKRLGIRPLSFLVRIGHKRSLSNSIQPACVPFKLHDTYHRRSVTRYPMHYHPFPGGPAKPFICLGATQHSPPPISLGLQVLEPSQNGIHAVASKEANVFLSARKWGGRPAPTSGAKP